MLTKGKKIQQYSGEITSTNPLDFDKLREVIGAIGYKSNELGFMGMNVK